ncbi:unnamed protein product [Coffea canephora]|uniref:Uncharacterized protein n=1 Tax=Coffea canephora TaxID=49390 RepID=A0A068U923_COFCA|nr:unnamed protein product [Coffea canephora]
MLRRGRKGRGYFTWGRWGFLHLYTNRDNWPEWSRRKRTFQRRRNGTEKLKRSWLGWVFWGFTHVSGIYSVGISLRTLQPKPHSFASLNSIQTNKDIFTYPSLQ